MMGMMAEDDNIEKRRVKHGSEEEKDGKQNRACQRRIQKR